MYVYINSFELSLVIYNQIIVIYNCSNENQAQIETMALGGWCFRI